ncbi:MAG: RNA polymerase sigma-70 factor [Bacteroidota bacterium]|nr:RNA polymerase sigma-70 factor [Bacteroidota bacterium]
MSNELFQKIISGDEKAFEIVFLKYFKSMCFNARLFGLSHDESKEVVQHTFLKFWEIKSRLQAQGPVENYLYKSLRNNCIDFARSQKKLQDKIDASLIANELPTSNDGDWVVYEELENKFRRTLENLPPQMKEIFVLSRIEGLKYKEIAERLGLSVKTVETQVSRALSRFRTELKDYLPFLLFLFIKIK